MKILWSTLSILALFFIGCATTPKTDNHKIDNSKAATAKVEKRHIAGAPSTVQNRVGTYPDPATIKGNDWIGVVPDRSLTPGAIDPCYHAKEICCKGCTTTGRRNTTTSEKDTDLSEYVNQIAAYKNPNGVLNVDHKDGEPNHEIDHLISLEIGGADDIHNLWPQPFQSTIAGATDKDKIENHSKAEMCAILESKGELAADSYQAMIQRVISAGYTIENGELVPPTVSWYTLYFADVLKNTDSHGKLNPDAEISYAATLEQLKAIIKKLPAPTEIPSKEGCVAPQISD